MLDGDATVREAELLYGPFGRAIAKPYAMTQRAVDGGSLRKVYLGVDPEGRRHREADTVRRAAHCGLSVPEVLATGRCDAGSWSVFRVLPGVPCGVRTDRVIEEYIDHVIRLRDRLHQSSLDLTPGSGWSSERGSPSTQPQFLLDQLSPRCRERPWWAALAEALQPLESHPVVYLHGDLKPEHLLIDGHQLSVVDWEASARGPAVVDYASVVFHLVRDLLYGGVKPGRAPIDLMTRLPFSGPVLAWRLLLWLDRRRSHDIDLIAASDVHRLAAEEHAPVAYASLAGAVSVMRAAGVPR
ncbi:aminoglycoside phosphotransferase family protein [Streptomyces silaceus]|uniref:aminoglycoside phosphotransferase family protein n=1 Tax=Streptomyces silaceus TaxID=545123 RepID=UPI0006EB6EE3|nr:aminoglycoside phosphotransferase family protein [Streptomyces silaceus]